MISKKRIIFIIVLIFAAVGSFMFFVPQKFFCSKNNIEIHSVDVFVDGRKKDITEEIDTKSLEKYIVLMEGKRVKTNFAPFEGSKVKYEINGIYNNKPFHVLLGENNINYLYESSEKGGYKINNSDVWISIVDNLIYEK